MVVESEPRVFGTIDRQRRKGENPTSLTLPKHHLSRTKSAQTQQPSQSNPHGHPPLCSHHNAPSDPISATGKPPDQSSQVGVSPAPDPSGCLHDCSGHTWESDVQRCRPLETWQQGSPGRESFPRLSFQSFKILSAPILPTENEAAMLLVRGTWNSFRARCGCLAVFCFGGGALYSLLLGFGDEPGIWSLEPGAWGCGWHGS